MRKEKGMNKKPVTTLLATSIWVAMQAIPVMAQETAPAKPQSGTTQQAATTAAQDASSTTEQQAQPAQDSATMDTIVVTGVRETQRDSIAVKRDASVIVDAVVNDEIGALPDNSVGETLERVAGVSADRFKGSASEISVRGMGPFLGFSTFNGREVSSGSGDRAVSFQQFPSELTNGVLVYKSQQADFVEGGISGIIELRSARPLDFNKRRIQVEARGNYQPAADRAGESIGSRTSGSYIDQFDTSVGRVGVALGFATTDGSAPEDFYTASSSFRPCNSVNANPSALTGGNCTYSPTRDTPTYFVPNQFNFRQLDTDDKRRAFSGVLQWQPSDRWDISLDTQLSKRNSYEDRHDLVFAEGRRGITPIEMNDEGALIRYAGNGYLESHGTIRNRDEKYTGIGLATSFKANEVFTISGDLSYSKTHREQLDIATRLRSNTLYGAGGRVAYVVDQHTDIPKVEFVNDIDLNNHDAFTTSGFARRQAEDRVDEIKAARLDLTWDLYGPWHQFKIGARVSDHDRVTDLENNNNLESIASAALLAGNADCRIPNTVKDWGKDSGTNIQTWAQFNTRCLYNAFTGSNDLGPAADPRSESDLNINERIYAGYAMGSFSTEWGSVPVSGNLGVRFIRTEVESTGYRGAYTLVTSTDPTTGLPSYTLERVPGSFDSVTLESSYNKILPSFNISAELRPDLYLKGAVYKAIARSNIEDLGAGRTLIIDGNAATPEEALAGASGGNPRLKPLQSWNYDLSLEYYQNPYTSYAFALYYKTLKAGAIASDENSVIEQFVIDGITYNVPVQQEGNSNKESYLRGFEVTANHAFNYLPGFWSGFGVQFNYNFAETNFEYPDPSAVEPAYPLADFTDPAGIVGLSKHTGSLTGYWEGEHLSFRAMYKYRSGYFKPSSGTANRFVDDVGFLDLSATYNISKQWQIKAQALNVTNKHQLMYRPVDGSIAESSFFGRSYFLGVRFRY